MKLGFVSFAAGLVFVVACTGDNQMIGADGHFDTLTLSSSGGMPPPMYDGDECGAGYVNVMSVTASPAQFAWDLCRFSNDGAQHTVIARGTRSLDPSELATVRDALVQVHIGNSGDCGFDKPLVTLDVQAGGAVGHYVDDFYGCNPPPDGRTFVTGIDWIQNALGKLAP